MVLPKKPNKANHYFNNIVQHLSSRSNVSNREIVESIKIHKSHLPLSNYPITLLVRIPMKLNTHLCPM